MKPHGSYKLIGRARKTSHDAMAPSVLSDDRSDRIVDSLRMQILEGDEEQTLRIRLVFSEPEEVYRVEIARPEQGYLRTTLIDRDSLEDLLATDDVRERVLNLID